MNIFGVGGSEFILILVIMLVIAGPKRMIMWSYTLGQYAGKLRHLWQDVARALQSEFDEAGLDFEVPRELPTPANLRNSINQHVRKATKPVSDQLNEIKPDFSSDRAELERITRGLAGKPMTDTEAAPSTSASAGSAASQPAAPVASAAPVAVSTKASSPVDAAGETRRSA